MINKIYIINLKERIDRKISMKNKLLKNNIDDYIFIEAIKPTLEDVNKWNKNFCKFYNNKNWDKYRIGSLGCMLSHIKIYKDVIEKKYEYVLILEDDSFFNEKFNLNEVINDIEKYKDDNFGIFYLGCTHNKNPIHIEKNIYKCVYSNTTHAYIISKKCINFILDNINNYDKEIDTFLSNYVQKKFNCYCFYPSIIKQENGFSDIQNKNVSYIM
jgi:glycosyl transferase, family 25